MTTSTTADLNYKPRPWQRQCHVQRKRFTVLATHRRAGKTLLSCMELIDGALQCQKELPLFAYCSPFLKQSRAVAWPVLKQRVEPLRLADAVEILEGDLTVVFKHNGARIVLYGADNPDALRGVRLDGLVVDEVAWVGPSVWFDILQPALSDRLGWALFIGTPSGINLFSELFFAAQTTPNWTALRFTIDDTNALDADEVERLKRDMPEQSFAREYLCDFSASGDDQLLSLSDVEVATKSLYTDRAIAGAPKVLGVDPARFGDDRSVIVLRQGLVMFKPVVLRGIDNMSLAGRVGRLLDQWSADACFVDSGAGGGVIDRLRELRYSPVEVPFGGRALKPTKFVNRRSEMWFAMADWLRDGGSIPNDPVLKQELATPVYSYDSSGRVELESKDEIRKRMPGSGSPDIADALALTFAAPVRGRAQREFFEGHAVLQQHRRAPREGIDPRDYFFDRDRDPIARARS